MSDDPGSLRDTLTKAWDETVPQEPPDMTGRYNTALDPDQEAKFQAWASEKDKLRDLYDYDLRGAWLGDVQASENGHLPDTFKKPNHPTFSDQSRYHGTDGNVGGSWIEQPDKSWGYNASPTNLQMFGAPGLRQYFQQREPGNQLFLPK